MKDKYWHKFLATFPGLTVKYSTEKLDFKRLVEWVISIIEVLITVIFSLGLLVFIWGVFKYIFFSEGDEKKLTEAKDYMIYGILGLFVMASVWGIVRLLHNTFFGPI